MMCEKLTLCISLDDRIDELTKILLLLLRSKKDVKTEACQSVVFVKEPESALTH